MKRYASFHYISRDHSISGLISRQQTRFLDDIALLNISMLNCQFEAPSPIFRDIELWAPLDMRAWMDMFDGLSSHALTTLPSLDAMRFAIISDGETWLQGYWKVERLHGGIFKREWVDQDDCATIHHIDTMLRPHLE